MPNNGSLNLRRNASRLIEELANVALVVVVSCRCKCGRPRDVMLDGDHVMVVRILRHQIMEPIPQQRNAAVENEQQAGRQSLGNSPHGGITSQWFKSS
jgi:virulence-associated protein VagC